MRVSMREKIRTTRTLWTVVALAFVSTGCTNAFFREPILDAIGPTTAVAVPGPDQVANAGQAVLLDGSSSFLLLGSGNTVAASEAGFGYAWTVEATPANAVQPGLANSNTSQTIFSGTTPGVYTISLTVSDGVHTGSSVVFINVL
jgi:hypothetical protein